MSDENKTANTQYAVLIFMKWVLWWYVMMSILPLIFYANHL